MIGVSTRVHEKHCIFLHPYYYLCCWGKESIEEVRRCYIVQMTHRCGWLQKGQVEKKVSLYRVAEKWILQNEAFVLK
jgi:hypothetical protein